MLNIHATPLKKLIKEKLIIGFIPVIDYTRLGLTHFKITVNLINSAQKKQLKQKLIMEQNIGYITESYGNYDLEFEVIVENINQLFALIDEINLEIPFKKQEIIFNNKEILVNEDPL